MGNELPDSGPGLRSTVAHRSVGAVRRAQASCRHEHPRIRLGRERVLLSQPRGQRVGQGGWVALLRSHRRPGLLLSAGGAVGGGGVLSAGPSQPTALTSLEPTLFPGGRAPQKNGKNLYFFYEPHFVVFYWARDSS